MKRKPEQLIELLMRYYLKYENDLPALFTHCKNTIIGSTSQLETAAKFWLLQKLSYSALGVSTGEHQLETFTARPIINLFDVAKLCERDLTVTNKDYSECISVNGKDTFIFADPPYKSVVPIYGYKGRLHKEFNHQEFSRVMCQCKNEWLLTYNDLTNIRRWFSDMCMIPLDVTYTLSADRRKGKHGQELLISNYNLYNLLPTMDLNAEAVPIVEQEI